MFPFLQLGFPEVCNLIDWSHPAQFLDTELQALGPMHEQGTLAVDRLIKVLLLDGRPEWVYIHVEIQAQRQPRFPERLFTYYYRILDKFGQRVVSLAVLADSDPAWRPSVYETVVAGCRLRFEFPVFKVLDLVDAEGEFQRTGNPFALVVARLLRPISKPGSQTAGRKRHRSGRRGIRTFIMVPLQAGRSPVPRL